MDRTSNPVLSDRIFENVRPSPSAEVMTVDGTVNKTLISLVVMAGVAWWTASDATMLGFSMAGAIVGFILALIISFKPAFAPALTPVYAAAEGCFLGAVSLFFETRYPGIVIQAVGLTFATLFCLLMAYKSGYLKLSAPMRRGVIAATGAICLFYLVSIVMSMFGLNQASSFLSSNSLFGIVFSLVVVAIAALNLVLDFDFIETTAGQGGAPKYMEWYGAFALLVTLVWLYLEILRLLAKLQSRD
jgi:uncharacterized YccA/Bax inhibitor family protein